MINAEPSIGEFRPVTPNAMIGQKRLHVVSKRVTISTRLFELLGHYLMGTADRVRNRGHDEQNQ